MDNTETAFTEHDAHRGATIDIIRISETTEERFGACRSMGIGRSIAIRFDPPLRPEFVEFVRPGVVGPESAG